MLLASNKFEVPKRCFDTKVLLLIVFELVNNLWFLFSLFCAVLCLHSVLEKREKKLVSGFEIYFGTKIL
jgi:hypothetical protein